MAHKVIILYRLYMPYYFLGTFTEYPYINFLTVGNLIILPALGIEEDEQALSQIKQYYPNCIIEQLNVSKLVKDGGGLNCISWCRYVNKKNPYVKSFSKKTNQT